MALEHYYDLVITDVRMPNIDGISCMEMIKRVIPEAAFIFITGFPLEQRSERVIKEHSYFCLNKPLDIPTFLDIVDVSLCVSKRD